MSLDLSQFNTMADDTIEAIADTVDDLLGDRIDADLQGGILTMTIGGGGGQYVVNKNGPMRQVWLASPVSGAWHFEWDESGHWLSTRAPKLALDAILAQELNDRFGVAIRF
jgi:frataxin